MIGLVTEFTLKEREQSGCMSESIGPSAATSSWGHLQASYLTAVIKARLASLMHTVSLLTGSIDVGMMSSTSTSRTVIRLDSILVTRWRCCRDANAVTFPRFGGVASGVERDEWQQRKRCAYVVPKR